MAVLHKKRNANTKKRARLMLGMAACVFAPTALAVWYLTALLAKRQPPAGNNIPAAGGEYTKRLHS